jgi:proline dehydrogenase
MAGRDGFVRLTPSTVVPYAPVMLRTLLLRMSRSRLLERQARRRAFVRRAIRRFMPGEELDDALAAGTQLGRRGHGLVLTRLGENVRSEAEADAVARHYVHVLDRLAALGLEGDVSVKPTQLGLDLGPAVAARNLDAIMTEADLLDGMVWVDMEDSGYVDRTLELVHRARERSPRVGVCLQAYLHRTPEDLAALMDPPVRVRLVKGAYREPTTMAIRSKKEVDARFHELAVEMFRKPGYAKAATPVFGTHDDRLIERVRESAQQYRLTGRAIEFHLLYGIRTDLQEWLTTAGTGVRVLIAYGEDWYPWYLRRLAERPANVWFVAKQIIASR